MSVLDFKTSRKEKKEEWILNYFLQATCYSLMLKEKYNINAPQIVILITSPGNPLQVFKKNPNEYFKSLSQNLIKYHL